MPVLPDDPSLTISPASGEDSAVHRSPRNGNENEIEQIGLDKHKVNTLGRDSFSERRLSCSSLPENDSRPTSPILSRCGESEQGLAEGGLHGRVSFAGRMR